MANPFIKIVFAKTCFSVQITYSSVNFTWFVLVSHQKFDRRPLFKLEVLFNLQVFWITSKQTQLTLHQSDILPQTHQQPQPKWSDFFMYTFLHIRYQLSGVFSSWEELFNFNMYGSRQISPPECSTHIGEHIYCHLQIYINKQKRCDK